MILVDTSVWVEHLRRGNAGLAGLLEDGLVHTHEFVIGELATGSLSRRSELLGLLDALPRAQTVPHEEAMALLERRRLWGCGLAWVDTHLLASAVVEGRALWTLDKRLASVAGGLKVAYPG
ncbi:MAG: PIN domain-containing protein [Phycisphaerales bacterium]|nr:PIN domain-containing protein [Phycisphaerales bacterium]